MSLKDKIKKIINVIENTDIEEIEISSFWGDDDIINKTEKGDSTEVVVDEELEYQKAPLVGTFYLSSKPGEPPFVSVGDKVSKGQTLCIIEAMKIFNEIESDFDGTIIEVLAEDAQPVEFNQPIFSIKESE